MKVKTNLALILHGERISAGSVIDIAKADYANLAAYVTVLEESVEAAEAVVEAEPVEAAEMAEPVAETVAEPVEAAAETKPKRKKAA